MFLYPYTVTVREIAALVEDKGTSVTLNRLADMYIGIDLGDAVWCAKDAVRHEPRAAEFCAKFDALLKPAFNREAYMAAQARKFQD